MAEEELPPEPLRRRLRARALSLATTAASVLPAPLLRGGLNTLAGLAGLTRYEQLCLDNLELALGSETDLRQRKEIARGVRRHTVRLIEDWLRLARGAPAEGPDAARGAWIDEAVELDESVSILSDELDKGRGAIVVTAHLGDWEMLCARLRRLGHDGAVVGLHKRRDSSANWLVNMRKSYGVTTLSQSSNPRELLRVLQKGGTLGLLCDLEVRRLAGEFLPLFGVEALTMTSPASLARAHRVPLIPVRCVLPPGEQRFLLSCEAPLHLNPELARRQAAPELMRRVNACFEAWIRETPEQWAWHQPRWRTRPGEIEAIPLAARD